MMQCYYSRRFDKGAMIKVVAIETTVLSSPRSNHYQNTECTILNEIRNVVKENVKKNFEGIKIK